MVDELPDLVFPHQLRRLQERPEARQGAKPRDVTQVGRGLVRVLREGKGVYFAEDLRRGPLLQHQDHRLPPRVYHHAAQGRAPPLRYPGCHAAAAAGASPLFLVRRSGSG